MSSKSRQKTHRPEQKRPTDAASVAGEAAPAAKSHEAAGLAGGISDELVHVPKNTSRLRFVLMIGLVIVLLIIFVAPGALQSSFDSDTDAAVISWNQPGVGLVELTSREITQQRRDLQNAFPWMGFVPFQLGFTGRSPSEESTARFLFLDGLAVTSGLHVSDADLAEFLVQQVQRQGGTDNYLAYARRNGGAPAIESTIRRCLRALRYAQVAGFLASVPDPEGIETLWADEHVEQTFEFITLAVADVADAARAELPPDEDLSAWFDGLGISEQLALQLPERRHAEFALFRPQDGSVPTELHTRYPEAEDAVADERAEEYYNRTFFRRFLRPADETSSDDSEDPPPPYLSFDEVKDICLAEAPTYFAMTAWLKELRGREGEIDLAAEAEAVGLVHATMEEPAAMLDLRELEESELGGTTLANSIFQTKVDEFAITVVVGAEQFAVVRVTEQLDPMLPPFADIRTEVADMWVDRHANDLALDRMRAVRQLFSADLPEGVESLEDDAATQEGEEAPDRRFTSTESFAAEAEQAGLTVQIRDWLDKSDFDASDTALDETTNAFFRRTPEVRGLVEGEVSRPVENAVNQTIVMARLAGERQIAIDQMTADQYESYKQRSGRILGQSVVFQPTLEELAANYDLWIYEPETASDEGDEGDESAKD